VLSTYRSVLKVPGATAFTTAAFIARLPISMIGLGIVLYISTLTDSYALAGLLTAAFTVSAAGFAIVTSRFIDRYGQPKLLPGLIAVHGVSLVAFVLFVQSQSPVISQFISIIIAGATQPAIGAAVRARWVYVLPGDKRLRSAFAWESILDELIFTVGPLLATSLALYIALPLPLIVAAALAVAGTLTLAALKQTAPPAQPEHRANKTHAITQPGIGIMIIVALGAGVLFGAFEVSTVAFIRGQDQTWATGVVLALFALGSMCGGLWFGARHFRANLPDQLTLTSLILLVILLPLPFIPNVLVLGVAAALAGTLVAPVLISMFALTQRLVPPALLTEGLTWVNSGLAAGFALGVAASGVLVDQRGPAWGFGLALAGVAGGALVAALARRQLAQSMHGPLDHPPAIPLNDDPVAGPMP
jgi:MFS family permease